MTVDDGVVDDRKVRETLNVNVTKIETYTAVIPTDGNGLPLEAMTRACQRARAAGLPANALVTFAVDEDAFEVTVVVTAQTYDHPSHPGLASLAQPSTPPRSESSE